MYVKYDFHIVLYYTLKSENIPDNRGQAKIYIIKLMKRRGEKKRKYCVYQVFFYFNNNTSA